MFFAVEVNSAESPQQERSLADVRRVSLLT